jgi:N-acetyl-anhydromuramyl-L-alanine amidase AmpD
MRPDRSEWRDYRHFDARWGREQRVPIGYADERNPNAKSIGIEILSVGFDRPSAEHYTEAMYVSLARLVTDICERYGLPRIKGVVVGHEDVNPIARWMWDPNQGFDWSRVWAAADV